MENIDSWFGCNDVDDNKEPEHKAFPKYKEHFKTSRDVQIEQENIALKRKIKGLEQECAKTEEEITQRLGKDKEDLENLATDILFDYGELHFHQTAEKNRKRESEQFQKIFGTNKTTTESTAPVEDTSLGSSLRENPSRTAIVDDHYPFRSRMIAQIPLPDDRVSIPGSFSANRDHDEFSEDTENLHTQREIQLQQEINVLKQKGAKMSGLPWDSEKRRNYIRAEYIISDAVRKELRIFFIQQWNKRYQASLGSWDDTNVSGSQLFHVELTRTGINRTMLHSIFKDGNTNKWDLTVLFDAILNSNSIGRTLNPMQKTEIGNLRSIRNELVHLTEKEVDDTDFQTMTTKVINALLALGLSTGEVVQIINVSKIYILSTPAHEVVSRSGTINEIREALSLGMNDQECHQFRPQLEQLLLSKTDVNDPLLDMSEKPGGYKTEFVKKLDDRFKCQICHLVLQVPYQTTCAHRYCESCIKDVIDRGDKMCPEDHEVLSHEQIFKDDFCKREILSLECYCTKKELGCDWKGPLKLIEV